MALYKACFPVSTPLNNLFPIACDLGHVTCFGSWDIWRHDASRGLICVYALGLVLWNTLSRSRGCSSHPREHCRHVRKKPSWRSSPADTTWNRRTTQLNSASLQNYETYCLSHKPGALCHATTRNSVGPQIATEARPVPQP